MEQIEARPSHQKNGRWKYLSDRQTAGTPREKPPRFRVDASHTAWASVLVFGVAVLMWLVWRGHVDNAVLYEGQGAADWIAASDSQDPAIRARAAYALTRVTFARPGEQRAAIQAEAHLLADHDEDVRTEAISGLVDFAKTGDDSNQIIAIASALLGSRPRADAQVSAARVLGALGPAARTAVPAIADLLTASPPAVRVAAIASLGSIGANDSATELALSRMVGDRESVVREAALEALRAVRARASTILGAAIPALTDTAPSVREQAAYTVGALQPLPFTAIEALASALRDSARAPRLAAADALGRALPSRAAQDALDRAANDPDSLVSAPARGVLAAHRAHIPRDEREAPAPQ